jgi:hypothetical protein
MNNYDNVLNGGNKRCVKKGPNFCYKDFIAHFTAFYALPPPM